ncbi:hypothetical protein GCM10028787_03770 [Brachybacterium horti]
MNSDAVGFILALFTGGSVAGLIIAVSSRRKGVRDADVAEESTAMQGLKELTAELRAELNRLKDDREKDLARIEKIEKEISVERDLRWLAISHIRDMYAWISEHVPGITVIPVPSTLSPYVHVSRKDPS